MLHLQSPRAAYVPDLRPVHGRVRSEAGKPTAIADEGGSIDQRRCTHVSLTYERQERGSMVANDDDLVFHQEGST